MKRIYIVILHDRQDTLCGVSYRLVYATSAQQAERRARQLIPDGHILASDDVTSWCFEKFQRRWRLLFYGHAALVVVGLAGLTYSLVRMLISLP